MEQEKCRPSEGRPNLHWFMRVAYDGTEFLGWQIQPQGITVQELIQKKLSLLFANNPIKVNGSGRTDAGVHSLGLGVSFSTPESPKLSAAEIEKALNSLLPSTIRVSEVTRVPEDFHARFSALAKAYTYVINTGKSSPFLDRWTWHRTNCVKTREIQSALAQLIGRHDFSAFTVCRQNIDDAVREIYRIDLQCFGDLICLTFVGNGFLYKMVRSLVGSLICVGDGRLPPKAIKEILDSKDRSVARDTAPPQGLFLLKVFYENNAWNDFKLEKPPFYL